MSQNRNPAVSPERTPIVVLTGGGSGGHITPLLSLAHALKQKNPNTNIIYIGHKGDKFDNLQEGYHDFDFIGFVNGGKFRRYHGESFLSHLLDFKTLFLNMRDFFRAIGSIFTANRILGRVKPDVVFSKGSFVAVPVGVAARLRRIPIVTHDSDASAGLANKIVGRWAAVHATGMPPEFYNYPKSKTKYVGIPVDENIKKVDPAAKAKFKKELGIDSKTPTLLVTGGGLGARDVNEKFLKIVPELLIRYPELHVIHIAGQKNERDVAARYKELLKEQPEKRVTILGFTTEFYKYSSAADIIVTRAGATTLAEFAIQQKPLILVPSPFLTGGHQLKNAEELKKINAVEVVDNDAPAQKLLNKITRLLDDTERRKVLARNLATTAKTNASALIADILLEVASKKK